MPSGLVEDEAPGTAPRASTYQSVMRWMPFRLRHGRKQTTARQIVQNHSNSPDTEAENEAFDIKSGGTGEIE